MRSPLFLSASSDPTFNLFKPKTAVSSIVRPRRNSERPVRSFITLPVVAVFFTASIAMNILLTQNSGVYHSCWQALYGVTGIMSLFSHFRCSRTRLWRSRSRLRGVTITWLWINRELSNVMCVDSRRISVPSISWDSRDVWTVR